MTRSSVRRVRRVATTSVGVLAMFSFTVALGVARHLVERMRNRPLAPLLGIRPVRILRPTLVPLPPAPVPRCLLLYQPTKSWH